jgi:uncharacterized protein YndB with AHSA1/START domain
MSEKKEKISIEYILKTSPAILFTRLSTASGLSEWFADDVNIKDNMYTFIWDKNEEQAELISKKENKSIRFRWIGAEPTGEEQEEYFEFQISTIELTGETVLTVTDFSTTEDKDDTIELWNEQIDQLRTNLGSV